VDAEADEEAHGGHEHHDEGVARGIGDRAPGGHGRSGHGERPKPLDQALVQVPVGCIGEAEALEELVGSPGHVGRREAGEPADELEVLATGQVLVDGCVLPGEADALAHCLRVTGHVGARAPRRAHRRTGGSS
jgi:hypothetical protein